MGSASMIASRVEPMVRNHVPLVDAGPRRGPIGHRVHGYLAVSHLRARPTWPTRLRWTLGTIAISLCLLPPFATAQPPSRFWREFRGDAQSCSAHGLADATAKDKVGQSDEALRLAQSIATECPEDHAPLVWLGETYAKRHDSANAAASFAKALALRGASILSTRQALTAVFAFARVGRNEEAYALGQIATRRAAPGRTRGLILRTMGDLAQQQPEGLGRDGRSERAYRAALLDLEVRQGMVQVHPLAALCRLGLALAIQRDGRVSEAYRILASVSVTLPINRLVGELPISEAEKEARRTLFASFKTHAATQGGREVEPLDP